MALGKLQRPGTGGAVRSLRSSFRGADQFLFNASRPVPLAALCFSIMRFICSLSRVHQRSVCCMRTGPGSKRGAPLPAPALGPPSRIKVTVVLQRVLWRLRGPEDRPGNEPGSLDPGPDRRCFLDRVGRPVFGLWPPLTQMSLAPHTTLAWGDLMIPDCPCGINLMNSIHLILLKTHPAVLSSLVYLLSQKTPDACGWAGYRVCRQLVRVGRGPPSIPHVSLPFLPSWCLGSLSSPQCLGRQPLPGSGD